jgi:hypothetical protein
MIPFFIILLACLSAFFRSRYNLSLEILALRQGKPMCAALRLGHDNRRRFFQGRRGIAAASTERLLNFAVRCSFESSQLPLTLSS